MLFIDWALIQSMRTVIFPKILCPPTLVKSFIKWSVKLEIPCEKTFVNRSSYLVSGIYVKILSVWTKAFTIGQKKSNNVWSRNIEFTTVLCLKENPSQKVSVIAKLWPHCPNSVAEKVVPIKILDESTKLLIGTQNNIRKLEWHWFQMFC